MILPQSRPLYRLGQAFWHPDQGKRLEDGWMELRLKMRQPCAYERPLVPLPSAVPTCSRAAELKVTGSNLTSGTAFRGMIHTEEPGK